MALKEVRRFGHTSFPDRFSEPSVPGSSLNSLASERIASNPKSNNSEPSEPEEASVPDTEEPEEFTCPNCNDTGGEPVTRADGDDACTECSPTCESCEEHCDPDELNEIRHGTRNGRPRYDVVCNQCVNGGGDYFRCGDCSEPFHTDNACGSNTDDQSVCESCAQDYSSCEDCDSTIHNDDSNFVNERTVCDGCLRRNYFRCDGCREYFPDDENDGNDYCSGCHEDEPEDEGDDAEQDQDASGTPASASSQTPYTQTSHTPKAGTIDLPHEKLEPSQYPHWLKDPEAIKIHSTDTKAVERIFGSNIDKLLFCRLFGLADGHEAHVSLHGDQIDVSAWNPKFDTSCSMNNKHSAVNVDITERGGDLHAHNALVAVGKHATGMHGFAQQIYHSQIMALREVGAKVIKSYLAVGGGGFWQPKVPHPDPNNPDHWQFSGFIGGKVWPLMGFGGQLNSYEVSKIPAEIRSQMNGNTDVRDLLDAKGGPEWWEKNFSSIPNGYMEMDPNSRTGKAHDVAWAVLGPRLDKLYARVLRENARRKQEKGE